MLNNFYVKVGIAVAAGVLFHGCLHGAGGAIRAAKQRQLDKAIKAASAKKDDE